MILPWKNYLETNEVSFITPDGVKYNAYPNSELYILKISTDDVTTRIYEDVWELEKKYLSDTYSDIYGVYESFTPEELEPDDYKQCLFGKTPDGLYLDRLQRTETCMDHSLTHPIIHKENWGILHTPDGGKTLYKTEWCDRLGEFYNTMKCDVFPDNPGWKKLDKAEVLIELHNELPYSFKQDIITSNFPLPHKFNLSDDGQISPIGDIFIP
tara:strand:+ start:99 stop:734 length:636 start_codon:yes stop_codon:yes gene_type:complete